MIFRIPTAVRAWIGHVIVDDVARGPAHRPYETAGFHVRDTSVYRFGPKPDA